MMLWRCWGLGWTKRGMLLPLSSSGYSPVSSRHMLSKCHEVTLSNSVTSSSPLCSFLPLPSQGGSQWLFRAWKLLATCSAHTLSTQQFLSLPLAAFSLHLTAPHPVTVCLTGVTHRSHRRHLQPHLLPPMFDLWRFWCHVAVKYGFWNSRSDYPGFCFNPLIESH